MWTQFRNQFILQICFYPIVDFKSLNEKQNSPENNDLCHLFLQREETGK